MGILREYAKVLDYWRRELIQKFNKNYLKNKLKKRRGKCKKCGKCCEGCTYLDKETKLCHHYRDRPALSCHKDFPLDKADQKLFGVEKTCGYRFKK